MDASPTFWLPDESRNFDDINALCVGTGRFLRSVLVPALVNIDYKPCLIQTRGRSFIEYMFKNSSGTYEVDTVQSSGQITTTNIPCYGAFSLGRPQDKQEFVTRLVSKITNQDHRNPRITIVGIGVTEKGLSSKDT